MTRTQLRIITVALAAASLGGCAGTRTHKGAVLDPQLVSSIQAGVDNKASVTKLLGTPTFTGQFTPDDWYYVSRSTRQFAFRNPRPYKTTVLHLKFDPAGNVSSVQNSGQELVLNLDPTKRKTPTLGRERSFFEELFGGIGSVSPGGLPGAGGGGGDQ
jgi:outer membrane protein assembly factor BamE (lipoprotein component of BamABCDE complex)